VIGESAKATDRGTLSERIPGRGGGGHWQAVQLTTTDHQGDGTELTKDVGSEVRRKEVLKDKLPSLQRPHYRTRQESQIED
jgi:hypothetical protein